MAEPKPKQIKSIFDNSEFPKPDEIDLDQYYEVEIEFENEVQVAWTFYFKKKGDNTTVAYRVGKEKCESTGTTNGSDSKEIEAKNAEITRLKAEVERLTTENSTKNTASSLVNGYIDAATTSASTTRIINEINETKVKLEEQIKSLNEKNVEYTKLNGELKSLIDQLKPGEITTEITSKLYEQLTQILKQNTKSVETNNNTVGELKEANATITRLESAVKEKETELESAKKELAVEKAKTVAAETEAKAAEQAKEEAAAKAKEEAAAKAKECNETLDAAKQANETALNAASDALNAANSKHKTELEQAKQAAEQAKEKCDETLAAAAEKEQLTNKLSGEQYQELQQPPKSPNNPTTESPKKPNISLEDMAKHVFLGDIQVGQLDNTLINPINEWIEYLRKDGADTTNINQIDKSSSPFKEILEKLKTLKKSEKNKDNLTKLASVTDWISKFNNKNTNSRKTFKEFQQQLSFELEKQKLTTDFGATRTRAKSEIEKTYKSYIDNLNSQKLKIEADLKKEGAKKTNKGNNKQNVEYIKKLNIELTNIEQIILENKLLLNKTKILKGINGLDPVPTDNKSTTTFSEQIKAYKDGIDEIKKLKKEFDDFYNQLTTSDVYKQIFEVQLNNTISNKRGGSSRKAKPRKSKSITFRAYS